MRYSHSTNYLIFLLLCFRDRNRYVCITADKSTLGIVTDSHDARSPRRLTPQRVTISLPSHGFTCYLFLFFFSMVKTKHSDTHIFTLPWKPGNRLPRQLTPWSTCVLTSPGSTTLNMTTALLHSSNNGPRFHISEYAMHGVPKLGTHNHVSMDMFI